MLVPGGYLLLNNHRNPYALASVAGALRGRPLTGDLTYATLRSSLTAAGFRVVAQRPIGAWMFRAALLEEADRPPGREATLERIFGGALWAPIAPDLVILARRS